MPQDNPFLNIYKGEVKSDWEKGHLDIPAGEITIGRPMTVNHVFNEEHAKDLISIYGWDNEFGYHHRKLESF